MGSIETAVRTIPATGPLRWQREPFGNGLVVEWYDI